MDPNLPGNAGQYLRVLNCASRVRVIVGYVRPGMRLVDSEGREQAGDGIRGHRGSPVGMDRARPDPAVFFDGALDELLREVPVSVGQISHQMTLRENMSMIT